MKFGTIVVVVVVFSMMLAVTASASPGILRSLAGGGGGGKNLEKVGSDGMPANAYPLAQCQGDCNSDDDCAGDLICYKRGGKHAPLHVPVPGCQGNPQGGTDYCVDPEDMRIKGNRAALCVVGCTPYVNPEEPDQGILKWEALVEDMAENCEIIAHVGDTKAGGAVCTKDLMTGPVHTMIEAGLKNKALILYSPGDNELNDCHRDGSREDPRPADFYKAADARQFLIDDLGVSGNLDLTSQYLVDSHVKNGKIPGTNDRYSCDFDKYVETDNYAVATIEVLGSQWYLADQTGGSYPNQDEVDPLADRISMYLNAKDCALEWISESAEKASKNGKRAVFFLFQAHFWDTDQYGNVVTHLPSEDSIGDYYSPDNLAMITKELTGEEIREPFQPLYDHLTKVALEHPDLMFYVSHADSHIWTEIRMNSYATNLGDEVVSHHNLMILQVEGDSRALTMYAKFTVDNGFQPVTVQQEWSRTAYNAEPAGHAFIKFQ